MWTSENRPEYTGDTLRYPSDLTDDEWSRCMSSLFDPSAETRRTQCSSVEPREIVNGLMYVLSTGCQWRYVPKDLPPKSTLFGYFDLWNWDGTLDRIHHALYVKCREAMDREASPTACVIDSQSVKSAEKGGAASIRAAMMRAKYGGARSAISSSSTLGLLLHAVVHPADIQIGTAACLFSPRCSACTRFYKSSLLMADIRARSFKRLQPKSCRICKSKSSNAPIRQKGSKFAATLGCRTQFSLGLIAAAGWPRISKILPERARFSPRLDLLTSESFV